MTSTERRAPALGRAGMTLVEMLIAMIFGVVLLTASTSLVMTTMRSMTGTELRDGIDRNSRFLGAALQRDLQETGVNLHSSRTFGTVGTYADTLVILSVPVVNDAPSTPYSRSSTAAPASGQGNCGGLCIEVDYNAATGPFQLADGDLAYVQAGTANTRRLLRVTGVATAGGGARRHITFSGSTRIAGHAAGLTAPNINLNVGGVIVQELNVIAYYRDAQNQLLRASRVLPGGALDGEVLATGVQLWDTSLRFVDGDEADAANPDVADPTNDFDDIARVHVRATVEADRTDARINNGVRLTRRYEWWFAPRNLMYERNAI